MLAHHLSTGKYQFPKTTNFSITFYDQPYMYYVAAQLPRHCNMITKLLNKNSAQLFYEQLRTIFI